MPSKNILLFFCMVLYFFQCQGVHPINLLDMIKSEVESNLGQNDEVDFGQLRDILYSVAGTFGDRIGSIPSPEDLPLKFMYSKDDAEISALVFVARATRNIADKLEVKDIVAENMEEDEVNFDQLKVVCTKVGEHFDITKEFLSIDVFQKASQQLNRKFTKRQVELYALAFVAAAKQEINELVKGAVETYSNPKSIDYKSFKKAIEEIKQATDIKRPYPSLEEFREPCIRSKYDAEEVERVVVRNLLPYFV